MTNSATPYGFYDNGLIDGGEPTFGIYTGSIGASNTSSIYQNDPAIFAAGLFSVGSTTGATGAAVAGIFEAFEWLSISAGMRVRTRAWLGQTADIVANSVVNCKIRMHPNAVMRAKVTGTTTNNPVTQSLIGYACNFTPGAGPGANLVSTFSIDATTLTATSTTLPFKVYGLVNAPASDPTSANNDVFVIWNNQSLI
jgi:hypothetical protein